VPVVDDLNELELAVVEAVVRGEVIRVSFPEEVDVEVEVK
jgi:hypothetical protein